MTIDRSIPQYSNAHAKTPATTARLSRYGVGALLSLLLAAPMAHADRVDVPAQQLRQINQDITRAQGHLRATQGKRARAQRDLRLAEENLANTHTTLAKLTRQHSDTTKRLSTLSNQLTALEKEASQQRKALAAQLNALYRLGKDPEIKLLLEQKDPTQLARYQRYLNAIEGARRDRLEALAKLNDKITANRDETQQQQQRLDKLIAAQRDNEKTLTAQQAQRQSVLKELNQSYSSAQSRLSDLGSQRDQAEQTLARIEREVAAARAAAARRAEQQRKQAAERRRRQAEQERRARETAKLAESQRKKAEQEQQRQAEQHQQQPAEQPSHSAPDTTTPTPPPKPAESQNSDTHQLTAEEMSAEAPSTASEPETPSPAPTSASSSEDAPRSLPGARWAGRWPINGVVASGYGQGEGINKNGIMLSAPEGTPIHALRAGQVVFASWLNGFGYLVILDHGSSLSVYAHNQRNSVSVGDSVKRGTVIGNVGDTGGLSSPALYFEVRRGGRPINPNAWVTASH
ncbi:hypothetical protein LMG33810_000485 [Carnimonas sp. LMG 33810]|uniref:murein hydrolase activator EnvC family protein n=2 Tax=Carnimonas bestiolae TaxID=3402172 RepID=UPI003EDCB151